MTLDFHSQGEAQLGQDNVSTSASELSPWNRGSEARVLLWKVHDWGRGVPLCG